MNIRRVPLATLVPDPSNARLHDAKNLAAIRGSLAKFGQVEPLVVQRGTNIVIGGNGRLAAMRELGTTEVDVVELDVNAVEAAGLSIALNRTGELAAWDDAALAKTLAALKGEGFGLEAIGFDVDDLARWLAPEPRGTEGLTDPDAVPETAPARTKRGDIWLMGPWLECDACGAKVDYAAELVDKECPTCSV